MGVMTAPALTRTDVLERLLSAEAGIRSHGVRRLALFGSFARDEARSDSDVDLYVEFLPGQKSFDRFIRLAEELEGLLGRPVELVTPEALSPFIGPRIRAEAEDVLRAA
jgi:predicted nucleotidyltransferase